MTKKRKKQIQIRQTLSKKKDKSKIRKNIRTMVIIIAVFTLTIFSFSFYVVQNHNSIREVVNQDPKSTTSKVTYISGGKGAHTATFEFYIAGIKHSGSTFNTYDGEIGDNIRVMYSASNPDINIYSDDTTPETFVDDVLIYTLEILGVFLGFLCVSLMYLKLKHPGKNIWELES
ncbi:hypothetical protein [Parabacteroides sp. FAFU027]|uniref:hypothetical protein n=1 Tax=Parabacteroides sp. FAFU027 TaxID=2922715 RepID=UPI001FB01B72|nr:hypothetical protein [Parabacteroides sp. FAFU027]